MENESGEGDYIYLYVPICTYMATCLNLDLDGSHSEANIKSPKHGNTLREQFLE